MHRARRVLRVVAVLGKNSRAFHRPAGQARTSTQEERYAQKHKPVSFGTLKGFGFRV